MAVVMLPGFAGFGGRRPSSVFGSGGRRRASSGCRHDGVQLQLPGVPAAADGRRPRSAVQSTSSGSSRNVQMIFVPFLAMLIDPADRVPAHQTDRLYAGAGLGHVSKSINDFSPLIFAIIIPLALPVHGPLGLHWPIQRDHVDQHPDAGLRLHPGPRWAWNFACFSATAGVLFLAWRGVTSRCGGATDGSALAGLLAASPVRRSTVFTRFQANLSTNARRLSGRRSDHRPRRRCEDQCVRVHRCLTHPRVPQHRAGTASRCSQRSSHAMIWYHLRLRTPEQKANWKPPGAGGRPGNRTPGASASTIAAAACRRPPPTQTSSRLASPLAGTLVPLADVPRPVFSKGTMGPSVAVEPSGDTAATPRQRHGHRGAALPATRSVWCSTAASGADPVGIDAPCNSRVKGSPSTSTKGDKGRRVRRW